MPPVLRLKNPLVYPGDRLPGLNPSHPATTVIAPGRGFSCVVLPTGVIVDLTTGKNAIGAGTTKGFDPFIGPTNTSGIQQFTSFAGKATTNDTAFTFAAIAIHNAPASVAKIFGANSSSATTGLNFGTTNASILQFSAQNVAAFNSTITLTVGAPYFLAISVRSGVSANWVALRLDNGKLLSQTTSPGTIAPVAPNGSYVVGTPSTSSSINGGTVAAFAFLPTFLSLPTLLAFAADPWSFWYPPRVEQIIGLSLAKSQITLPPKLGTWIVNQY